MADGHGARRRCAVSAIGVQRTPPTVLFGRGIVRVLAEHVSRIADRALVIVDPFVATTSAFDEILTELTEHGIEHVVVDDFEPELPVAQIESLANRLQHAQPRVIVAIGGGSALDLAKVLGLLLTYPGPLSRYYGENTLPGPTLPLIAVPTTAGTGSEVTSVAVVADSDRAMKVGISDPALVPTVALVDPLLSASAPASVTAHAGADALAHALESLTSIPRGHDFSDRLPVFVGRNLFSDMVGLEAAGLIGEALPKAVSDGSDLSARDAMAWGSLLAGMSFGNAGTHVGHALQYPIGAMTGTPHGLGTGMLLPFVLQASLPFARAPLERVATQWRLGVEPPDRAQATVDRTEAIVREIGLPSSLSELGITADDLDRIAERALGASRLLVNSPFPATPASLRRILQAALVGDRSLLAQPSEG